MCVPIKVASYLFKLKSMLNKCLVLPGSSMQCVLRFMICCDRCEEWFHGDCVGITEARGRLMERNSEDYVCPNCTGRKGQGTKPFTSTAGSDPSKQPAARRADPSPALVSQTNVHTLPPATTASSTAEEKTGEEVGIKGRIEKAANPSGKKKIKIFQPVGCCIVSVCFSPVE